MSDPYYAKNVHDPISRAVLEAVYESKCSMHPAIFGITVREDRAGWSIELRDCDAIIRDPSSHNPVIVLTLSDMQVAVSQKLDGAAKLKSVDLRRSGSLEDLAGELARLTILYMEGMVEKSVAVNRKHYASFWTETIESYTAMPTWADVAVH